MAALTIDVDSYKNFISRFPAAPPFDLLQELSRKIIALKSQANSQTIRVINFHNRVISNPEQLLFTFLKLKELHCLNPDGSFTAEFEKSLTPPPKVERKRKKPIRNLPHIKRKPEEWIEALKDWREKFPDAKIKQSLTHEFEGEIYRIGNFICRVRYNEIEISDEIRSEIVKLGIDLNRPQPNGIVSYDKWMEVLQDWRASNPKIKLPSKQVWEFEGRSYNLGIYSDSVKKSSQLSELQKDLFFQIAKKQELLISL